ncbi:2-haloacid dehalogenase [Nonlabens sp. Hel1_33_55]|uniref:haloacid dehalogenase type II n=1 Tax=Nonlabens sp. Hel1_33_55 TaxID=1336802 RepID=UPI000875D4AC|nr:haloacid dehalogenase type II [Nonlabens sp. Hel1_33_55]SCY02490.1 2-haloacid dehalogenase [Nonlabens sp. Hel1_33_55]
MEYKLRPKVLFFDVNETLLDLSNLKENVSKSLNGNDDLIKLWFTTLLQYSLVTSASGQYEDFGKIGAATLQMVATSNDIHISESEAQKVVIESIRNLNPHAEVKKALIQLRNAGYTLVAFTNGSNEGVKEQIKNAVLTDLFDELLSVESAGKFKPFKEAYDWAAQHKNVKPEECMMIAAHGWDVAGAQWAGWRAAFIARPGQQQYPLAPEAEITGDNLQKVTDILLTYSTN